MFKNIFNFFQNIWFFMDLAKIWGLARDVFC